MSRVVGSDTDMSVTRVPYPSAQPGYAAAAQWRDRCLLREGSLFEDRPGSELVDARVLVRDFVEQPDQGKDDFLTKLHGQLSESPASAVQLAAELLFVHFLVARSDAVSGSRKKEVVRRVLSFTEGTSPLPDELASALDAGLVRPGQAFNSYRWRQFGYLIDFFIAFKELPVDQRREALTDSDAFLAVLARVEDQGAAIQRHALEHLLFPEVFPPIVSRDHRAAVISTWGQAAGPATDPEPVRLARVVQSLPPNTRWGAAEYVNLYRSPFVWQWSEPSSAWRGSALWAKRLSESIDLEHEERQYKVDAARRVMAARTALEGGRADWPQLLGSAFTKDNNLVACRPTSRSSPGSGRKLIRLRRL